MTTATEEKKPRKLFVVLVSLAHWPPQEPGRKMVWSVRPLESKAQREAKRLTRRMPECTWEVEAMTAEAARKIRLKPFDVRALRARQLKEGVFAGL